jgi:phosphopantothenoylcysteine decarboxylase / phosphopantothenate---cysteine ligase
MNNPAFHNKKILVTAGPTREAIDPVRYISNHSTGKMGYAIAAELLEQGAEVILVSGPVAVTLQHPKLKMIHVTTASEMYLACCRFFEIADVAIFTAAVADYRPEKIAVQKIKKSDSCFSITMTKNIDIAFEFGKVKRRNQVSVGFALETNNEQAHAIEKLNKKNFDMVILNSMNDANATFGFDTNKISIFKADYSCTAYPLKPKKEVAVDIVHETGILLALNEFQEREELTRDYETMYQ